MTDQNYTDVIVLLDKSGSMRSIAGATVKGVDDLITEQAAVGGKCLFTLIQFNVNMETTYDAIPICEAGEFSKRDYRPGGATALMDALGYTINNTGVRFQIMKEEERPNKVLFVIVSDGLENQSQMFRAETVAQMIAHQENYYKWEFVFIGTDFDVAAEQDRLKFKSAYIFNKDGAGTDGMFKGLSRSIARARTTGEDYNTAYVVSSAQAVAAGTADVESLAKATEATKASANKP
jgi:hypothetical protein